MTDPSRLAAIVGRAPHLTPAAVERMRIEHLHGKWMIAAHMATFNERHDSEGDSRVNFHQIPSEGLRPSRYEGEQGHWSSTGTDLRLMVEGTGGVGFGVGYVDATGECRRTHGGRVLPGPYAYAYGMAAVIDNRGGSAAEIARSRAAGLVIEAQIGDILTMPDGEEFWIQFAGPANFPDRENIKLLHTSPPCASHTAAARRDT